MPESPEALRLVLKFVKNPSWKNLNNVIRNDQDLEPIEDQEEVDTKPQV